MIIIRFVVLYCVSTIENFAFRQTIEHYVHKKRGVDGVDDFHGF